MILYLDTSLLMAAMTNEAHTKRVQAWLRAHASDSLAISDWVMAEPSSVLSIKLRKRQIAPADRAKALAMFSRVRADSVATLPVSGPHFRTAARFADQHALGLPAGDALHLAICAEHGATLCTLDRRLGKAGPAVGVQTMLP